LETEGRAQIANRMRNVRQAEGLEAANQLWLSELLKAEKNGQAFALDIASQYARQKNHEQTLEWLEKAADQDARTLSYIKLLARYDFVRDDERFQRIVQKIDFKQ
jgi:TPR repeat protein